MQLYSRQLAAAQDYKDQWLRTQLQGLDAPQLSNRMGLALVIGTAFAIVGFTAFRIIHDQPR